MKTFEGILLCSDFDGTFYHGKIPENNIKAVREFMDEGGHFTFCTGRRGDVFKRICKDFKPNVPLIGMGGGQLYDLDNDVSLKQVFFGPEILSVLRGLINEFHGIRTIRVDFIDHSEYFMPNDTVILKDYWTGETTVCTSRTPLSRLTFEECEPIYKAVAYFDFTNAEVVPMHVNMICKGKCNVTANAWNYVELMPFGFDKGTAALELKKSLGDRLLVGVGDFMGDVSLLKAADIGYAVDNALPMVKNVADKFTVNVDMGALDSVIQDLRRL